MREGGDKWVGGDEPGGKRGRKERLCKRTSKARDWYVHFGIATNRATQLSFRLDGALPGAEFSNPKDVKKASLLHPTPGGNELSLVGQSSVICD